MAKAAGRVVPIPEDEAALAYEQIGSDFGGWLNFQPMHQKIVRLQPDLLEEGRNQRSGTPHGANR